MHGIFVTGTDTGVGKTVVTAALLRLSGRLGIRAVGLKPIASGAEATPGGLRNADALELQSAAPLPLPYDLVNPCCFEPAIAPHLAARVAGRALDVASLGGWFARATREADLAIVEGAGGWRVPLHPAGFMSDLPETLGLDVLLVVAVRLGCLNHARLTHEAIVSGPCRFAGWIANETDPSCERSEENVDSLTRLLGGAPLARLPHAGAARSPHGHAVVELPDTGALRALLGAGVATRVGGG